MGAARGECRLVPPGCLSRYTVQVHVSRILAKLQVRSRVEVASQIARHQAGGNEPRRPAHFRRPS